MHYGARFYDPYINRFISADSIVLNSGELADWNPYAYCRNNPLRYTDPSGYFTDAQTKEWTRYNDGNDFYDKPFSDLPAEILELLRAMHFGDVLNGYKDGELIGGVVTLDEHKYLRFGTLSVEDLMTADVSGWSLTRNMGDGHTYLVHETGDGNFGDYFADNAYMPYDLGGIDHTVTPEEFFFNGLPTLFWREVRDAGMGAYAGFELGGLWGGTAAFIAGTILAVHNTADDMFNEPGSFSEDRVLTYYYQSRDPATGFAISGQGWTEQTVIRGDQVIETTWEPYGQ